MSQGLRLLSAISDHGCTTTLRNIDPAFLVDDDERTVYEFMRRHYRRHNQLPSLDTIEEETRVSMPDTTEPVDYYVQEVHNRHIYNSVRDQFSTLRDQISRTDVDGIMRTAVSIRRICTPYSAQERELQTIADISSTLLAEHDALNLRPDMSGVPTGWEFLDRETNGFQNGDLVVIVARPAIGKTHLLINSARHAWESGKSILFVSMEMTLSQVAKRFAAHYCGLDPDIVRKGQLSYWGRRRYAEGLALLEGANNFHLYAGNFKKSVDDLDALVQELNPDAVYIDGLYIMRSTNASSRAGRYEQAAYVIDDVKQLALMRDRPVIATTQFGRAAGKRGEQGSLESIGYTDAISTHASIAIGIKMGAVVDVPVVEYHQNDDGSMEPEIVGHKEQTPYRILEIMKGREGESGSFAIRYGFAPTQFKEVSMEEANSASRDSAQSSDVSYMLP